MTENEEKVLKFIWKIENYSYWWKQTNSCLESPRFEMDVYKEGWRMELYPRGVTAYEAWVSVYLERVATSRGPLCITVDYEIALLGSDGTAEYLRKIKNQNFLIADSYGFLDLAEHKEIFGSKRAILLPDDILTVQCRIFRKGVQLKMYSEIITKTRLEIKNFVFRWEPLFTSTVKFYRLRLKGMEEINFRLSRNYFSNGPYLCIGFKTTVPIKSLRFRIHILDCNHSISRCLLHEHYFNILERNVGLINLDEIRQHSSLYLRNNKLSLQCDLSISFGIIHSQIEMVTCDDIFPIIPATTEASEMDALQNSHTCSCTDNDASFRNDFQTLYQEGTLCDFTLKVESENIQVHKAVLGARSPVFKAMLTSNMKENAENMVEISDFDANTIHRMLTFMYTNEIGDLDFETAHNLYFAADKYDIKKLKHFCTNFLIQKLCLSNFGKVLKLAVLHADDYLKKICVKFLCDNETVIMRTTEWKTFVTEEPQLAEEIVHCIHRRKTKFINEIRHSNPGLLFYKTLSELTWLS